MIKIFYGQYMDDLEERVNKFLETLNPLEYSIDIKYSTSVLYNGITHCVLVEYCKYERVISET